jgi:hypothetical protein
MITNGAYIHSDDIKNEKVFNRIVSAACAQNIECNWSWVDYDAVQEDGVASRLVAKMDLNVSHIDIEISPLANRVRWPIERWVNSDERHVDAVQAFKEVIAYEVNHFECECPHCDSVVRVSDGDGLSGVSFNQMCTECHKTFPARRE